MIILVPMGGFGTRFTDAGYTTNKPCIPTYDRHTGTTLPMVLCAIKDIPGSSDPANKIICVDRDFHATNGTEQTIRSAFPDTVFIHDHVLLDQAFACLLARDFLKSNDELFIGACDNGIDIDIEAFERKKAESDVIMISHSGDQNILRNPNAHSWAELGVDGKLIARISIKKALSDDFMNDHATTGMFWFKHASDFLKYLEKMIWEGETLQEKHLVDRVLQYCIDDGLKVQYHDVKYHCWGTPQDYEEYQQTYEYWSEYVDSDPHL